MPSTYQELLDFALSRVEIGDAPDVLEADSEILEYLLDNCEITVPAQCRFFVAVNCDHSIKEKVYMRRGQPLRDAIATEEFVRIRNTKAYSGAKDYGHTSAEWESVIAMGIPGLKQRLEDYAAKTEDAQKLRFYRASIRVHAAALRFILRAAEAAHAAGREEMAQSLRNLTVRAPETLYEALQLTLVYYTLQQRFEGTRLRTMGRLDALLYPFYKKEDGEFSRQLLLDYILELNHQRAPANLPFAIGGTDENGESLANPLSYALLEAYLACDTDEVKLHLLCGEKTPDDLLRLAFEGIRAGKNSIVFLSDRAVTAGLMRLGASRSHAVNYHVVGCYECGAWGELPSSCNARVNIPKAVELALNGGRDMLADVQTGLANDGNFPTYDAFYAEVCRQLRHLCGKAMEITDYFERNYAREHSALFLSATYTPSVEHGGDLYCQNSARYSNSSVNAIGLATAADSLLAIRKLVYEDKTLTLAELAELLRRNWEGQELLRLNVQNRFPKYGQGDPTADAFAAALVEELSKTVNGHPNAKGGIWRLGLISIDWRWEFGKATAASADGRKAGETLSLNTGASFGADRMGATAHLRSVAFTDGSHAPNGAIADIGLHESAVRGENGLNALCAALRAYFDLGGFGVHYNVLDAEVLKKARLNPQDYPNLQVRLCGWNVLFASLEDHEKDEFIARWSQA